MVSARNEVKIKRPVGEVYRFLADGLNNPKWRSAVTEISLASGSSGTAGAVYRQRLKGPFGRPISGDYRLVDAVPNARIRFEVIAGPARPTGVFDLRPDQGGTRVAFSLSMEPTGFMRFMKGMIQRSMSAEVQNLAALKSFLEAQPQ